MAPRIFIWQIQNYHHTVFSLQQNTTICNKSNVPEISTWTNNLAFQANKRIYKRRLKSCSIVATVRWTTTSIIQLLAEIGRTLSFPTTMEHTVKQSLFKRLQQSTLNTFANSSVGFEYQVIYSSWNFIHLTSAAYCLSSIIIRMTLCINSCKSVK